MYVCNSWLDTLRNFLRASAGWPGRLLEVVLGYLFFILIPVRLASDMAAAFSTRWQIYAAIAMSWSSVIIAAAVFAYSYLKTVRERLVAVRVARQKILTREFTYELLSEGLNNLEADREILRCLEKKPLPLPQYDPPQATQPA